MLSRKFTRRESVLLVLLAVVLLGGLYAILVHIPVENQLSALELERQDAELELEQCTARLAQYNKMKSELDEIFALPESEISVMPAYDNIRPLMEQMNVIFWGLEPTVNFGDVKVEDRVVLRPVSFSFRSPSYTDARRTLSQLTGTGWRCLLDGLTITGGESRITSGPVSVSGNITFYENAS